MSDIEFNETINGYRGAIGKLVFRKVRGRTVVSRKAKSSKPPTEAQLKQRANMSKAVAYGRLAKGDPALMEYYGPIALQKESSIYQVALQDCLKKSSSKLPDLSKHQDRSGEASQLTALDDTGVASLNVKFVAQDGMLTESGQAAEIDVCSGKWIYTVIQPVAQGTTIFIEFNRPSSNKFVSFPGREDFNTVDAISTEVL